MKNLTEQEIFSRLYAERRTFKISRKDLTEPDYEVWGRARLWLYHQAVCLLAGFTPIDQSTFDRYFIQTSRTFHTFGDPDIEVEEPDCTRYALRPNDIEKMRKMIEALNKLLRLTCPTPTPTTVSVTPAHLLHLCKNNEELASLIPQKLATIVEAFGAHPSQNLPHDFSYLELNVAQLDALARKKAWETTLGTLPPPIQTTHNTGIEQNSQEVSTFDQELLRWRPEQLAKAAARGTAAAIWKKKPKLPSLKLTNDENFKKVMDTIAKINEKKDGYTQETLNKWILDLRPGYQPKS
jgi:hypothetical protein